MAYPHIETAADYAQYEADVAEFLGRMEGEPSGGAWECPLADGADGEERPCKPSQWHGSSCEIHGDLEAEPFFSWTRCDCCDRNLGGDREDVIGWLKGAREHDYSDEYKWSGSVCVDCVYYFAYGRLDDQTMLAVGSAA